MAAPTHKECASFDCFDTDGLRNVQETINWELQIAEWLYGFVDILQL